MDETVLVETIKRMKDSGLEDDIILDTLEDVGISRERGKTLLEKASKNEPLKQEVKQAAVDNEMTIKKAELRPEPTIAKKENLKEDEESIDLGGEIGSFLESAEPEYIEIEEKKIGPVDKIINRIDETKLEHDLHHTTLQAAVVQQANVLEDLHKTIQKAATQKPECPLTMSEQVAKIQTDIEKIKEDIDSMKGDIAATKELLEKVLESTKKLILRIS
ncbi:MAG: hypothetical protein QXM75_00645 [Candidatus Diapherotrites archaeon]